MIISQWITLVSDIYTSEPSSRSVFYGSGACLIDFQISATDNVTGPHPCPLMSLSYKPPPPFCEQNLWLVSNQWKMTNMMEYHSRDHTMVYKRLSYKSYRQSPPGLQDANCHAVSCLWRGPHGRELWVTSRSWGWPSANSQQKTKALLPATTRNWICQQNHLSKWILPT